METWGSRCQRCLPRSIGKRSSRFSRFARGEGARRLEIWKKSPSRTASGMKDEKEIEFRSRGLRCTPAKGLHAPGSLVLPSSVPSLTVTYRLTDLRTHGRTPRARSQTFCSPLRGLIALTRSYYIIPTLLIFINLISLGGACFSRLLLETARRAAAAPPRLFPLSQQARVPTNELEENI